MPHSVVWFDVPVTDLDRSIRFYSAVLGVAVKKESYGPDFSIGLLPHEGEDIGGCLAPADSDNQPSGSGPLIYLNCQGRLAEAVEAVEKHGGKILKPIHQIGPHGSRAVILDSEGNRVALHST